MSGSLGNTASCFNSATELDHVNVGAGGTQNHCSAVAPFIKCYYLKKLP